MNFSKLTSLFIIFVISFQSLYSISTNHPRAQSALNKIQQLQEVRSLISEAEKAGPITVRVETLPNAKFEAFWDSKNRIVRINEPFNKKEGVFIGSLLFELHNAAADQQLKHYFTLAKQGGIGKEKYVEGIEKIEHKNAVDTSTILEKGIRIGLFPQDARWPIYRDFEDHYKVQQIHGHSAWIGDNYDELSRQRTTELKGTIAGLHTLSPEDKSALLSYLHIKNDLESPIEEQARRGMEKLRLEQARIENSLSTASPQERNVLKRRVAILHSIFKGHETLLRGSNGLQSTVYRPEFVPSS